MAAGKRGRLFKDTIERRDPGPGSYAFDSRLLQAQDWTGAGTRFHSIVAQEAHAVQGSIPEAPGWRLAVVERRYRGTPSGPGDTGLFQSDVLFLRPNRMAVEFDWKTTTKSTLGKECIERMDRRRALVPTGPPVSRRNPISLEGYQILVQESRHWTDYGRPHLAPGTPLPFPLPPP